MIEVLGYKCLVSKAVLRPWGSEFAVFYGIGLFHNLSRKI